MSSEKHSLPRLTTLWKIFQNVNNFANHVTIYAEGEAHQEAKPILFRDGAWPWQRSLLEDFEKHRRIVILKARQIGVSWLLCIYALYCLLKYNGYVVLMMSRTEKEAKRLIRRISQIYSSLPDEIKEIFPITRETQTELEFANNSTVIAMTSTPASGRSFSASLFILDEFAFFKYADENWAAMMGAAERGSIIVVSTANGINNKFYKLYTEAVEKTNNFHPVFLPYNMHPQRDTAWWNVKKKEMPQHQLFSEYPRDDIEAFTSSGAFYFSREILSIEAPSEPQEWQHLGVVMFPRTNTVLWNYIKVFQYPTPNVPYAVGIDSAITGSGDNAAIVVLNALTGEQVLEFAARVPYTDIIPLCLDIAENYSPALMVPERNQIGAVVTQALVDAGCEVWHTGYWEKLFSKSLTRKGERKYGFATTHATKPTLFAMLEVALKTKALRIASHDLLRELVAIERKGTKIEATGTGKDDRVIALALAWLGVASLPHTPLMQQTTPIMPMLSPQQIDALLREQYYRSTMTEYGFMGSHNRVI